MSDQPIDLDGPRLAPANGGPATSLIVFLHGYGADGNDLIGIGSHWAADLPSTAFAAPHAPQPMPEMPAGRQWFPLASVDPASLREGVTASAPALDRFLDMELARLGLDDAALMIVGFSQGTMMALHVGPRRLKPPAGIIGYSGLLPDPEFLDEEMRNVPPVLLVHGGNDPLIPPLATQAAREVLERAGFAVEAHVRPGLEHGIDEEGLRLGADFAGRRFAALSAGSGP